ncbi:hypothetical protein PR202_gb26426 [Eleusine coracana subsp. coracana]|uniref:Uncharacterized protein n=1 Tax=Eleusine coracana subsp. coracana TaxID=191504 RepID=A0AAV5FNW0_ELECO|nr:hypothetical protein PR202_gb26426 [Eleusine coracana subsp. coracana]
MDSNNLTGTIPASLANLSLLRFMVLGRNQLEGPSLPASAASRASDDSPLPSTASRASCLPLSTTYPSLEWLQFTGSIPASLSNLTTLQWLDLSYNTLSGHVPSGLGKAASPAKSQTCASTGRSPTDDMFDGSFDLHKFSKDAIPDRIWEIVDPTMWLHNDGYNSTTRPRIHNCLVSVIALGISCSRKQPRERIPIQDATIELACY